MKYTHADSDNVFKLKKKTQNSATKEKKSTVANEQYKAVTNRLALKKKKKK